MQMKMVLLSADNNPSVYSVPDIVADHLRDYCLDFCTHWLHESPNAEKYRVNGGLCYTEKDFIEYLNKWLFPDGPSCFIETLDANADIPQKYQTFSCFHF